MELEMTGEELRHALSVTSLSLHESRKDAMARDVEAERYKLALNAIAELGGAAGVLAEKALERPKGF